jgi:hypothetical protein
VPSLYVLIAKDHRSEGATTAKPAFDSSRSGEHVLDFGSSGADVAAVRLIET